MSELNSSNWVCISCGEVLGHVLGGELHPAVPGDCLRTAGPNLAVRCPKCGGTKTFYTSDPIVRAIYQLIDASATVLAKRAIMQISDRTIQKN